MGSWAYRRFLGRSPDTGGENYWVGQMQSGMSLGEVDADFLASSEYVGRQGGGATGWLNGVYRDLLDRPPDAAGLRYWSGQLQAGVSQQAVALAIATSFEHEALVVGQDFQTLLGQAPGTAVAGDWVSQLQQGGSDAALAASLIGSAQYYNDPAKGNGDPSDWVASVFRDLFGISLQPDEAAWWVAQLQAV